VKSSCAFSCVSGAQCMLLKGAPSAWMRTGTLTQAKISHAGTHCRWQLCLQHRTPRLRLLLSPQPP
jgi:hypothetical protein